MVATGAGAGARPLAITSLVFGILSVVGILLIFLQAAWGYWVGLIPGIAGLTVGIVAQIRGRSGFSLAGLILSAIGLASSLLLLIVALVIYT